MKAVPLNDNVVILPEEADDKSPGGILIPDTAKEKPKRGKVLAVGPGRIDDGVRWPVGVKVGDSVLYGSFAGVDTEIDGLKVKVLREAEILAKLE